MKVCTRCGLEKELAAFSRRSTAKDGRRCWCRECCHAYSARRRKEHGEEVRANYRRYYKENAETCRARTDHWRETHLEKVRESQARYYRRHKRDAKDRRVYLASWYMDNKEHHNAYGACWRKEHPELVRTHGRRRRARRRAVSENFTVEMEQIVRATWAAQCAFCGETKELQIDHWRPLSKGHALTPDNAVLLCRACNTRKGAKLPEELADRKQVEVVEQQLAEQAQRWLARELVADFFAA